MSFTIAAVRYGAALAIALAIVLPGGADADTLADAVALAYANNPTIRAQRAALDAVNEQHVQARSAYGPHAQVSISDQYEQVSGKFFGVRGVVGHEQANNGAATLTITQSLYSGGRNRIAVDAADAAILTQRETLRQTETQVLQQVVVAYVAVRRDQASLAISRDNVAALERQLRQVSAEFDVRQVTLTDLELTNGRLAQARSSAASAAAQLEISRSLYLQVVGESPGSLDPEPELEIPPDVTTAFDIGERNNPSLAAVRYQEQLARIRVAQARANYLPNVSAQVGLTSTPVQAYSSKLGSQQVLSAGVTLSQPLFESGLFASQVRQALALANQAEAQIEVTRRAVVQGVAQAWSQLVSARTALAADEAGVEATRKAFYGARREQVFGLRAPIDVLNAQQEFNTAEARVLQDRYNEYLARTNLLAVTGVLVVQTFAPNVQGEASAGAFNKVAHKGDALLTDALQTLDSIAVRTPRVSPPALRDGRPPLVSNLKMPAAPASASRAPPLVSATSVIEQEDRERPTSPETNRPASCDGTAAPADCPPIASHRPD